MAASNPGNLLQLPGVLCGLLVSLAASAAAAPQAPLLSPTEPIHLHASHNEIDSQNNRMLYRDITITQGGLSISADEANATGLDFKAGEWIFKGSVHIVMPTGKLDADTATISFADSQISRAKATGSPATFESQRPGSDEIAHGRAATIDYDVSGGTVRLLNNAWLSNGGNEISGNTLVYEVNSQKVIGNPGKRDKGGIDIIIRPNANGTGSKTEIQRPGATPKPGDGGA
jgi:lipopolysaccharide export system protein LptA